MKNITRHLLSAVAANLRWLALLLLALSPAAAQAAVVTLTNTDASGTSSFNAAGNWDSGAAPASGNDYCLFRNVLGIFHWAG